MQDFPANSQKARADQPREKVERVTSAEAVRRKRGLGQKFKETFMPGDARSVSEHVVQSVILPGIRDLLFNTLSDGIERMFFGDTHRTRRPPTSPTSYGRVDYQPTPYNRMSGAATSAQTPQRMLSRGARARHNFDDLIIPSRQEAEEVLDRMYDMLSKYGRVEVSVLYELTGIQSSHTDMKWGWTDLRGAKAVRLRNGGFLLDLPEPEAFV
jgi:hypothetical protein